MSHRNTHIVLPFLIMGLVAIGLMMAYEYAQVTAEETRVGRTRVVAQTPALAQLVRHVGGEACLVASCTHDPARGELPALCDSQSIQLEALLELKPTLILTQTDPAAPIFKGVRTHLPDCEILKIPLEVYRDLGRGAHLIREKLQLEKSPPTPGTGRKPQRISVGRRPEVIFVSGHEQLLVAGDPTYIGDLIRRVYGVNIGARIPGKRRWKVAKVESILALKPAVLIVHVPKARHTEVREFWEKQFDETVKIVLVSDPAWLMLSYQTRLVFFSDLESILK